MTRPHVTDATLHEEFVVIGPASAENNLDSSSVEAIQTVRTMAENILTTCDRLSAARKSCRTADMEPTSYTSDQTTQTEGSQCNEQKETSAECERHRTEMDGLKRKLKEVVDMNVGWQLLHDQREKHVAELTSRIRELEQLVTSSSTGAPSDVTEARAATTDDMNDAESWRRKYTRLEDEKRELEAQNLSLHAQLDSAQDLAKQLEQAVDRLNGDVESVVRDKQTFIEMLQAQILVYKEDFECERKDRERAQGKLAELKTELESLKHPAMAPAYAEPRYVPIDYGRAAAAAHHGHRAPVAQRPAQYYYYNYGRDEVDCDSGPVSASSTQLNELTPRDHVDSEKLATDGDVEVDGHTTVDGGDTESAADLRCPNCRRAFTIDQHVDLMDHIEVCS